MSETYMATNDDESIITYGKGSTIEEAIENWRKEIDEEDWNDAESVEIFTILEGEDIFNYLSNRIKGEWLIERLEEDTCVELREVDQQSEYDYPILESMMTDTIKKWLKEHSTINYSFITEDYIKTVKLAEYKAKAEGADDE